MPFAFLQQQYSQEARRSLMRLRPLGQLVGFFRKVRLSEVLSRPQIVRMSTDVVPEAKMDIATTDKSPADSDQPIDLSTVKEDVGTKRPNEEEEEGGAAAKKPKTEGVSSLSWKV